MRKTFYLPTHIRDRLLKFRQKHEMMDEQIAIIRLIDAGLRSEENTLIKVDKVEIERKGLTEGIGLTAFNPWASFFKI